MSEIERAIEKTKEIPTRTEMIEFAIKRYKEAVEDVKKDRSIFCEDGESNAFFDKQQLQYETSLSIFEAELEREKNPLTCDGCEWQPKMMGVTRCQKCARFPLLTDRYEPKGEKA